MIDEADEFVAGPQNKHKRPGEPNMQGIPKRRRCMSPLLRGRQQNPVVNNHIGGKGPPVPMTQAQPDLLKPLPLHKSKSFSLNVICCSLVVLHGKDFCNTEKIDKVQECLEKVFVYSKLACNHFYVFLMNIY